LRKNSGKERKPVSGPSGRMKKSHSYIVIGLFPTEISTTGVPLALVWKGSPPHDAAQLEVLFAEDLDQHTARLEPEQRQWVDELVHSIRRVASNDSERADALFERLANLNVGPVRTMTRGCSKLCGNGNVMGTLTAVLQRLEAS
jgi:hypothetical protein